MNLNLNDNFKINDSHSKIRGFVTMRKENGDIIFSKENMIVKTGRAAILNAILPGSIETSLNLNLANFKFFLGVNADLTSPEDTYDTILAKEKNFPEIKYDDIAITKEENPTKNSWYKVDINNLFIHYHILITTGEAFSASSAGILLTDPINTEKKDTLFSRVVFPATSITPNTNYYVDYYIYF